MAPATGDPVITRDELRARIKRAVRRMELEIARNVKREAEDCARGKRTEYFGFLLYQDGEPLTVDDIMEELNEMLDTVKEVR